MQNLLQKFLFLFLLSTSLAEGKCDLLSLSKQYNEENISQKEMQQWLNQFDKEDQDTAALLLEQIHYLSYPRLMKDLKLLHQKLLIKLKKEGFVENAEKELAYDKVDFSKTYPAKSGDLISYFYRSSNLMRAVCFKNLGDLSKAVENDKALVILEDYVGTGTQFLFELYSKRYNELFNSYQKVYFVVLVATKNAVNRFEKITLGDYDSLAQDFISIMNIEDENQKKAVLANVKKIPKEKLELIYLYEELPLNDPSRDPKKTNKIMALLDKYNIKRYLGGNFSSFGHTVFFYNCPNNLPEILWNSQSIHRDGTPWIPLFKRVEDLSIYDMSKNIPIQEQIW